MTFSLDSFKRTLLPFFEQNTMEVFHTKGFNELSDTTLAYILLSDELTMDEYEILKAIKGWAVVNSVSIGTFPLPYLKYIVSMVMFVYFKSKGEFTVVEIFLWKKKINDCDSSRQIFHGQKFKK